MQIITIKENSNPENTAKPNHNSESRSLINQIIEKLAAQLEQGYSDAMKQYLKSMSRFHSYSLYNLFLILGQKPNATRVTGFRTWNQLNRKVKKGEKGIRILAPVVIHKSNTKNTSEGNNSTQDDKIENILDNTLIGFRIVCVFDESQTDGETLPEPSQAIGKPDFLLPALEQAIRSAGIELEYGDTGNALGISKNGKIIIKSGMEPAETFNTLLHEFAHQILHPTNSTSPEDKFILELEAEAVACVVCEHYQIQALQSSADYIQLWNGNRQTLLQRLEQIRHTASQIIQTIEKQLPNHQEKTDSSLHTIKP